MFVLFRQGFSRVSKSIDGMGSRSNGNQPHLAEWVDAKPSFTFVRTALGESTISITSVVPNR